MDAETGAAIRGTARQVRATLGEGLASVGDLFFPRNCLITGVPLDGVARGRYLSPEAMHRVIHAYEPCCETCGFPYFGMVAGLRVCPHCEDLEPVFQRGRTLFLAREAGRAIIHELKYRGGRYLEADIGHLLRGRPDFCDYLRGAVLVPVPLFAARERKRGFNQSLLLCRLFAQAVDGLRVEPLLERVRDTGSQTRLNRRQRYDNVKNAFAPRKDALIDSRLRYVLVDDVFTTGATLNACADALRRGGAGVIDVATLGHG